MKNKTLIHPKLSFKIYFLFGFALFLAKLERASAQNLYLPPLCDNDQALLLAKNLSSEPQHFWLGYQKGGGKDEVAIDLENHQKWSWRLGDFTASQYFKIYQPGYQPVDFQLACEQQSQLVKPTLHVHQNQEYDLKKWTLFKSDQAFAVHLANVTWLESSVEIIWLNDSKSLIKKEEALSLKPLSRQNAILQGPLEARYLLVQSSQRFVSVLSQKDQHFSPTNFPASHFENPKETKGVFFEMGLPQTPSAPKFIVLIEDPNLIAKARTALQKSQEKIVFGEIGLGHGGYNYDLANVDRSAWSWHYKRVTNIDDIGSTSCNGSPEILEDQLGSWLNSTAYACFWNYRLLREIKPGF